MHLQKPIGKNTPPIIRIWAPNEKEHPAYAHMLKFSENISFIQQLFTPYDDVSVVNILPALPTDHPASDGEYSLLLESVAPWLWGRLSANAIEDAILFQLDLKGSSGISRSDAHLMLIMTKYEYSLLVTTCSAEDCGNQ